MKSLFILTGVVLFLSCSKKEISVPGAADQNFFFKDENIAVQNFQALPSPGMITINFATSYEKNVQRIELMGGATTGSFCTIQGTNTAGNSTSVKNYSFQDSNLKGAIMYYMLRFEDNLGQWSYSDYYTVEIH